MSSGKVLNGQFTTHFGTIKSAKIDIHIMSGIPLSKQCIMPIQYAVSQIDRQKLKKDLFTLVVAITTIVDRQHPQAPEFVCRVSYKEDPSTTADPLPRLIFQITIQQHTPPEVNPKDLARFKDILKQIEDIS